MSIEIKSSIQLMECPTDDIAAFIDGELDFVREIEMDGHFTDCSECSSELNRQKDFLRNLDISLRVEDELKLPKNFTKHIVANAQSTVSGLRRPRERFNAVFIIAALLLFALFAMGAEVGTLFERLSGIVVKTVSVGSIFGHLIYSFFVGLAVIVRGVAAQSQLGVSGSIALSVFFAILSFFVLRKVLNTRRPERV